MSRYREKDGRLIHDGDCDFWSWKVCTCGLLRHLLPKSGKEDWWVREMKEHEERLDLLKEYEIGNEIGKKRNDRREWALRCREAERAREAAEDAIGDLREDLHTGAKMLLRQRDLAREAERERDEAEREASRLRAENETLRAQVDMLARPRNDDV